MKEFLSQYGQFILVGILAILELILFACKNRPKVIDNSLITNLCQWILEAEDKFKIGSDKMSYVLDKAREHLRENFKEPEIRNIVEYLLTIPEKKVK